MGKPLKPRGRKAGLKQGKKPVGAPRPVGAWDVHRLVTEAGGPEALMVAHADHGFKPLTKEQISNWKTRYVIPSNRLAEILIALRTLVGGQFDPMNYIALEAAK